MNPSDLETLTKRGKLGDAYDASPGDMRLKEDGHGRFFEVYHNGTWHRDDREIDGVRYEWSEEGWYRERVVREYL